MRTTRCAIVVSAVILAGCGDSEEPTKVDLSNQAQPAAGADMLKDQMKSAKMKGSPTGKTAAPEKSAPN